MKKFTHSLRAVALVLALLMTTVVAGPAMGQDVDTKGENELREHAQKIDQAAGRADAKHVTTNIVEQWQGKTFDFGDGKGPHALTASDVQSLRQKGLGYGEISILLALANRTGQSTATILQMRQSGMGWGQIAHRFNLKLGPVISSVKAMEKGMDRVARAEKVDRVEKMDKGDKVEKPERPERVAKPGR